MSTYRRQVEIASGGTNGVDFELVDYSDGNGVQIKPLKAGFTIPSDGQITAAQAQATNQKNEIAAAKSSVKSRPTGSNPAELDARLTAVEALLADLIKDA